MAKAEHQLIEKETLAENELNENFLNTPTRSADDKRKAREQALKAIASSEIPYVQSKKLIGAKFDLVDAFRKTIDGEKNISFVLVLKTAIDGYKVGDKVSVSKKLNAFTEPYVDYFESFDANETPIAMENYTFLEEGAPKAGNQPVILRKL